MGLKKLAKENCPRCGKFMYFRFDAAGRRLAKHRCETKTHKYTTMIYRTQK